MLPAKNREATIHSGRANTLVFLISASVFLAGCGRLLSISKVGVPEPSAVWLGYLVPELLLPIVMVVAQIMTNRSDPT